MIVSLKHESKHVRKGEGPAYVVSKITNPKIVSPSLVGQGVMIDGQVWQVAKFEAHPQPSDLVTLIVQPHEGWRTYQELTHMERAWVLRHFSEFEAHVLSDSEFCLVGTDEVARRKRRAPWVHELSDRPRVDKVPTSPVLHVPELDGQPVTITTGSPFKPLGPALATVITAGTGLMRSNIFDGAIACAGCGSKMFKVKWSPVALACNQCGQIVDTPDGEVVGALVRKS